MSLIDAQRLSMIIFEHGDSLPKDDSLDAAICFSLVEYGRRSYERVLVAVCTAAVFEPDALVAAWAVVWGTWLCGPVDEGCTCGLGYTLAIDFSTTKGRLLYWRHLSLGGDQ